MTMLNLLFSADDISFTPLSRVFAVAIMENPFFAATSSESSGMDMRFSERMEMRASCTSLAQLDISSNLAIVPVSIALYIGLLTSDSNDGPFARSIA